MIADQQLNFNNIVDKRKYVEWAIFVASDNFSGHSKWMIVDILAKNSISWFFDSLERSFWGYLSFGESFNICFHATNPNFNFINLLSTNESNFLWHIENGR